MLISLLSCLALTAPGEGLQAEDFAGILKSLHGPIETLTFEYEGNLRWVGAESILQHAPSSFGEMYQGVYHHRANDAEVYEAYHRRFSVTSPASHRRVARFRGEVSSWNYSEDAPKNARPSPIVKKGTSGLLRGPQSPLLLNYVSYFAWKGSPAEWGYKCYGWEDLGGHRCLVISLNIAPSKTPDPNTFWKFWVDLERGGHPLQIEKYRDSKIAEKVINVQLAQFTTPSKEVVWLPVHAEAQGFDWNGVIYGSALSMQTVDVLQTSVIINSKLGDDLFKLDPRDGGDIAGGRRAQQKLTRTDPAGVEANLVKLLNEADAQSSALDASTPSSPGGFASYVASWSFIVFGAALLVGILYYNKSRGV